LVHYGGASLTVIQTPTNDDDFAVWASSADDVFVAGAGGTVRNRQNGTWTSYEIAPGRRLRTIWGYSHDEVYVAGSNGALYRFDGSCWSKIVVAGISNYDPEVRDLWGPAPGSISLIDLWNVVWFDGITWDSHPILDENVYGLWGFDLLNQVAVSAGSSTHVIDGTGVRHFTPTEEPLFDVWGTAPDNCYAVGRNGNVAHFDGTGWEAMNSGSSDDVHDIWAGAGNSIAVGSKGLVLHQNGDAWTEERVGDGYELSGVWKDQSGFTVAVGRFSPDGLDWRQAVLTSSGGTWTDAGPIGTAFRLLDVWGSGASEVYAVGWAGEIIRFDGVNWNVDVAADSLQNAVLRSVTGIPNDYVLAVGGTNDGKGLIYLLKEGTWTRTVLSDVTELTGVWASSSGRASAVGSRGTIRRFDGQAWKKMTSPTSERLLGIWGPSENDLYATGWRGTLLHYDGNQWRLLLPQTHRNLNAVSGMPGAAVLIAGDGGAVLRLAPPGY
jgi:hypothetical protein